MFESKTGKKRITALLLCLLGFSLSSFFSPSLFGHNAFNIGLSRFEAMAVENGVRLEWDVESEIGTAGYTIKRGENGRFDYLADPETLENLFILAEGGPAQAFSYSFLDDTAVQETTYTYQLIEISAGSSEQLQDEVTISYRLEATSTPVTFSGDVGSRQENNNPTSTPTVTPAATATASGSSPAPNAQPTTAAAQAAQQVNPTVGDSEARTAQAPDPPPAENGEVDAYPGNSLATPEAQVDMSGSGSAAEPDNGALLDTVGDSAVGAYPPNETLDSANPGQANALESPVVEQPLLSSGDNSPVVIGGATSVPVNNPYPGQTEGQNNTQEAANADSTRILMWLAFLVSLIIFTASVLGAILLYSRERSKN